MDNLCSLYVKSDWVHIEIEDQYYPLRIEDLKCNLPYRLMINVDTCEYYFVNYYNTYITFDNASRLEDLGYSNDEIYGSEHNPGFKWNNIFLYEKHKCPWLSKKRFCSYIKYLLDELVYLEMIKTKDKIIRKTIWDKDDSEYLPLNMVFHALKCINSKKGVKLDVDFTIIS